MASLGSESGIYIKTAVGNTPWTLYLINSEGCVARVTECSMSGPDYAASLRASWSLWPCRRFGHELPWVDKEVVCTHRAKALGLWHRNVPSIADSSLLFENQAITWPF